MASPTDNIIGNIDPTVRVFDTFYNFDLVVNGNEYDIVYGYFFSIQKNKAIAANFTAYLFMIAQVTGITVMNLLDELQGQSKLQVNQYIAYYLNSFKTKTALYGVAGVPRPVEPVQRNIVQ